MLKLQNRWTNKTFFRKNLLLRKCLWTRGLQLCQPGKKFSFRLSVFWIRVRKKCERLYIFQKLFSPKTFTDTQIAGFAGSKHWLRIGKKSELFSLEKKFSKTVPADIYCCFANTEKCFPPLSRKLQKLSETPRVFKTSIRKCCSVSVPLDKSKVFLTTLPKTFLQNHTIFLSKSKKTKNQLFNKFFWHFFLCTLRLLFQHTWPIFLPESEKIHWKSKRDDNTEKYFNYFFSKFCWGHVKWKLATCRNFLPKYGNFRSETKNDQRITLLSKRASKQSAARVGCSFEKFDKKFTPKIQ